jgi:phosphoserine phosphatase
MLSIVGHPVAVCPDFRLKQVARQHDWAVLDLR